MKRRIQKKLAEIGFVVALVTFAMSLQFLDAIGPVGLIQFGMFMVSGGYVVLFMYANWDLLIGTKKERQE